MVAPGSRSTRAPLSFPGSPHGPDGTVDAHQVLLNATFAFWLLLSAFDLGILAPVA